MSKFRQYQGNPQWLFDPASGQIAHYNRIKQVDVQMLDTQTDTAPLLNRARISTSNTTGRAAIGDVITVTAPPGMALSNIQGLIDKGAGFVPVSGFTSATFTLTASEIAPAGQQWPLKVQASLSSITTDELVLSNPVSVPAAPTIGTATAGNQTVTGPYTAPTDTGGSAITSYDAFLYVNGVLERTLKNVPNPAVFTSAQYVQNGVTYQIRVRANNAIGPGPMSAFSNAVTPATVPLVLRAVSDRVYTNQNRSGSAKQIGGYRTIKINSVGNQFELTFANWFTDGSAQGSPTFTELGSGGPAIFRSQVELAGVFYPVMFSGSLTGNAADAANAVGLCDIPITVAGTEVKVHGYQQQTGAGFIVHGGSGGGATSVTFNAGKDLVRVGPGMIDATATGDWANAGGAVANGNAFGPIMVRALTSKPSVVVYGTSIDFGAYGTQTTVLNSGVVGQQLSDAQIGFVNAGVSSDSVRKWLASSAKRVDLAASATTVIFGGPVNDVTSITPVRTAAEIFADMRTQWALFPGKNLIQCTMTPLATNAAGQTPHANIAVWIAVNNLIRTNTDGVKVFDIAEATCPVGQRDACIWRTTTISNDGVHPNDAGFDLIRASGVVDISKIL